jgi:hypothetical protein
MLATSFIAISTLFQVILKLIILQSNSLSSLFLNLHYCSTGSQGAQGRLAIMEEGPMLNKLCYEALHRTLVDLAPESDKKKFGGKLILVSSDFCQLLPVIEKANRSKIVGHTLKLLPFCGMKMLYHSSIER